MQLAKIILTTIFLALFALPALAQDYLATYRQGDAPLKRKATVRVQRVDQVIEFAHLNRSSGGVWSLPLAKLRGAQKSAGGVWLYWFDDAGQTKNAYFRTEADSEGLAGLINQALKDYYGAGGDGSDYRQRFESYKERALREAQ